MAEKQHKNKHGVWATCSATKRACRYGGDDSHRIAPTTAPQQSTETVTSTDEATTTDDYSYDDNVVRWTVNPQDLEIVKKRIDALNARLEKAGADERFEYEVEIDYKQDPESGLMYETAVVTLNRPTLKQNGWTFVSRVDEIFNEDGENSFIVSSLSGESVTGNYDLKELKCDHCGQKRHRAKTYILRDENGQFKQVGSNCMQPFLGLTPSFWSLDPDYVHQNINRNASPTFSRQHAIYKTENLVALGLALSKGGQAYAGRNSEGLSTKEKVMDYLFNPKTRKETVDETAYLEQARTILAKTDFSGDTDYAANMRNLVKHENASPRHWGYVLSSIPVYMKQTSAYEQREKREPYKGFVGEVNEKVRDIPARIIKKHVFESNGYSYYNPTIQKTLLVMETQDKKLVKWVTSSLSDAVNESEEGDFINIQRAQVKGHGEFNGDDQTVVTNAKIVKANN